MTTMIIATTTTLMLMTSCLTMSETSCWPTDQKSGVFIKDDNDDYRNDNDTDADDFLFDDERSFLLAN
jgi:hypothetical protein